MSRVLEPERPASLSHACSNAKVPQRGLRSPSAATQTGLIGPAVPGVEEAAVRWVVTDQQLLHRPHGGDVI